MNVSTLNKAGVVNPFPGLRPFQQGEEHLFFGREQQTDSMVDKLCSTRFLTIIGSSGCGKSSLVNCGLRMALHGGLMAQAGSSWRIAQCRPAGNPIGALASALANEGVLFSNFSSDAMSLETIIETNLRMSKLGIVDVFEQAHLPGGVNLLIVIDQFEELFRYGQLGKIKGAHTQSPEHDQAKAFINLLLAAREQTLYPIYIVLTMRSDFLGDCTQFEGLAEVINEAQYLVPRMTRDERRSAIAGPVGVSGSQIDPVLLTRLVNDLGDDPDQLSILQHALNRLWVRREVLDENDEPLSLRHYQAIGSMSSALDLHAESAYAELSEAREQTICEKLFKALTNKATDLRGVRRPTRFSTLCNLTSASAEELTAVIDVFRQPDRSFLMPPFDETLSADTIVDISHESLMRMWRRLIKWTDEEAESTQIYMRLANTAALHANNQAGLWRDPDLQLALEWRSRTQPNETWAERISPGFEQAMQFLDESRAAHDIEKAEELRLAEQENELKRSRVLTDEQAKRLSAQERAANKQKQVIALAAGGLVVTTLLSALAWTESKKADERAERLNAQTIELKLQAVELRRQANALRQQDDELVQKDNDKSQVVSRLVSEIENRTNLAKSKNYSERLHQVLWKLASENGLTAHTTETVQPFRNLLNQSVLILTLNEQGHQTSPVTLEADQGETIDGYVNQIWIARGTTDGEVVGSGIMSEAKETVVFENTQ